MNIEEIDKWLDNEYGCSYTRLEELHDFVIDQDLKHREEADKEIERLNNIIKELEKWLIKQEDYNEKVNSIIFNARGFEDKQVLNKLQELKGSDN